MALRLDGAWRGVLLRAPSGGGKTDLALRLVEAGWRLVADDRVVAWASGGRAWGRAPAALCGLAELRGQGMARLAPLPFARVALAIDLGEPAHRQPDPDWAEVADVRLPRHTLRPDGAAPARLRLLLGAAV